MITAMKLSVGNGQSYDNVNILTTPELLQFNLLPFGPATFCFQHQGKLRFSHVDNINVVHFTKSRLVLPGALPYEKLVLADDAIYSGGVILLPQHHEELGVHDIMIGDESNHPILFTASPEGLLLVRSGYIATLECQAFLPGKPELRNLSAHRLAHD